jgi:outer membrane protein OmpA-like peptidoglycan-associated protein
MKNLSTNLSLFSWLLAGFFSLFAQTAQASDNYFDYLPKYRKFKSHYQIDKIEFRDKRTIVYFRYIAQEDGSLTFYGTSHPSAWYLRTPPRVKGLEIQFKMLEMRDIRVNNESKIATLTHLPEMDYTAKRGDVITYEIHFVRVPNYVRMVDMIEGNEADLDEDKSNCFDIMVKTKDSPLLGTAENSEAMGKRFDQSFTYAQPKSAKTGVADPKLQTAEQTAKAAKYKNLLAEQSDAEPIDYIPKQLLRVEDIKCMERVTLPDVKFRDNETAFSGRVKAVENVKMVAEYLKTFPEAVVRLHGHTDIHGDEYKNLELSKERAMAVKRELVIMGVEYDRVELFYYGGKQPLINLKEGGDSNRRVEVEAVCKKQPATATKTPTPAPTPTPKTTPEANQTQLITKDKAQK